MPRIQRSTPAAKHTAIELRKDSTPTESKLWAYLRKDQLGVTFRRQHAIGLYIVDFCLRQYRRYRCSPAGKLIIELDGSQHMHQEEYDADRTAFLASQGYRVLRFWNSDVMNNINDVLGVIRKELERSFDLNKITPL